jgi:hypothetical protein
VTFERSDQPRCCGYPSWISASSLHRLLDNLPIQKVCQSGAPQQIALFQLLSGFAVHELDHHSCLFERHKLKAYAANRDA